MRLFWSGRVGKGLRVGTSVPLTGSGKPADGSKQPTGLAVAIIVLVVLACAVGGGLCGWAVAGS